MINLLPMNGYVLVELTEEYEGVFTVEKKYDTKTSGIVIKTASYNSYIGKEITIKYESPELLGKKVYFEGFKDDSQVKENDKIYAFIDIKDIRGWRISDEEQAKWEKEAVTQPSVQGRHG